MKKKVTSIILSAAMAASMLGVNAVPAMAEEPIKIGVSIWSSTDVLGSQCKLILDAAAEALGVEVQYVDQGHVSEKVTASVDQLCAAGCQGIVICNSADTEMTSAIATCNLHSSSASSAKKQTRISMNWLRLPITMSVLSMRMSRRTARSL